MGLIMIVAGIVTVFVLAAAADRRRYLESLPSPPPHIHQQAQALDKGGSAGVEVQGNFHYYDREIKKEVIATDTHAVKVVS